MFPTDPDIRITISGDIWMIHGSVSFWGGGRDSSAAIWVVGVGEGLCMIIYRVVKGGWGGN